MILVDTSAWFACSVPSDRNHGVAQAFLANGDSQLFVTTDYVLDEYLTLLKVRGELKRASDLGRRINELQEIQKRLGRDVLQDVQVWHLYGGWFGFDFVWRAKAPAKAVLVLREKARMHQIQLAQMPVQFWEMPSDRSEMPSWWDPKPVDYAEYYMSPTFEPRRTGDDRLDCVAMYNPDTQMLYVWSQWDF